MAKKKSSAPANQSKKTRAKNGKGDNSQADKPQKSEKTKGQRVFRDRLFKFIFGNDKFKKWTLMLYNALSGSHYTNVNDLELRTLEDVVYMSMKNDVSFFIDGRFIFLEQQSTHCPNMPARFFLYVAMAYQAIIQKKENQIYAEILVDLPLPKCICFYNGPDEKEDRSVLKLSDAFKKGVEKRAGTSGSDEFLKPDIEVLVTMLNINYGHNKKLLDACRPLKEYSWFCEAVRENRKHLKDLEKAIDKALETMPKDFVIRPLLIANKAEVKQMCLTEYNEAETLHSIALVHEAEGEARGEARGIEIGRFQNLAELVDDGTLTFVQAAKKVGMTVPQFKRKVAQVKKQLAERESAAASQTL